MALSQWEWSTVCVHIRIIHTLYAEISFWIAGLKLEDLRKVYFEMKDKVFKQQSTVLTTACDTDALETLLQKVLGTETTLAEEDKPKQVYAWVVKE